VKSVTFVNVENRGCIYNISCPCVNCKAFHAAYYDVLSFFSDKKYHVINKKKRVVFYRKNTFSQHRNLAVQKLSILETKGRTVNKLFISKFYNFSHCILYCILSFFIKTYPSKKNEIRKKQIRCLAKTYRFRGLRKLARRTVARRTDARRTLARATRVRNKQ